ncbi:Amino acid transporter OS=Streptomyces fumanus OX=67302 GN=GCM10018772_14380 PE=4 SV=1 [Streptomyces fumanus]
MTAGIDFGAASFLGAYLNLQFGFEVTPGRTVLLFAAILLLHGLLNTFGVRIVGLLNSVSVWWHVVGVLVIVGALTFAPDRHRPASFVFGEFVNNTGWSSGPYVVLLGLLMAQYTFTGYDASAHMTEETRDAATAGPQGIVRSIWTSWIAGFVLLLGFTFAIQSYEGALDSPTGAAPAEILLAALGATAGGRLPARHRPRPARLGPGGGDRRQPLELRLLPRRRAVLLPSLAHGPPRAFAPRTPRCGWPRWPPSASACRLDHVRRTPGCRRSPSSASASCTSCRACFRSAGAAFERGRWHQGRWLPRRRASGIALPGNDFWLIDNRLVRWNHFTGDGASAPGEISDDPAAARLCATAFEAVWKRAVPHDEYEIR